MVRLFSAALTATTSLSTQASLLELYAPALLQTVRPGQFCMFRCCSPQAYDPLLRRPLYIHSIDRVAGLCSFLVYKHGRGSHWLLTQPVGTTLDLLGPLGHGWKIPSGIRNLLLVAEEELLPALILLAHEALTQEVAVTILYQCQNTEKAYPPALLPPEVEYQVVTNDLISVLPAYLSWADALCCSVSRETALTFYNLYERVRGKNFAQAIAQGSLICGTGICLLCNVETRSGSRLLCREGPVFDLRELVR